MLCGQINGQASKLSMIIKIKTVLHNHENIDEFFVSACTFSNPATYTYTGLYNIHEQKHTCTFFCFSHTYFVKVGFKKNLEAIHVHQRFVLFLLASPSKAAAYSF